jgi:hypothetical protein
MRASHQVRLKDAPAWRFARFKCNSGSMKGHHLKKKIPNVSLIRYLDASAAIH